MPPTRPRRPAQAAAPASDSDSDETVIEAPKARSSKKKRVTEFLVPLGNGADGFAEQRKERRQSSFRAREDLLRNDAPKTPHKRLSQINSIIMTPAVNVSKDVMSSNFEEWMKMATDNKINTSNTWNFALIDYFHDMSLLRNDVDNSINFQKASCTLDGCVKVWTSRVDSVSTETGKLLSNLANDGRDEDDERDGGEEGGEGDPGKKRKAHRPESTLAKSLAQLRTKKLDLEFTVDPLFKKTSADFDEGGAQGLLMNHLGVDGNMRVVFDAGDSRARRDDEDEEEPEDVLDLGQIRQEFLPSLAALDGKAISHSLLHFSFTKDLGSAFDATFLNETFRHDLGGHDSDDSDDGFGAAGPIDDFDSAEPMSLAADAADGGQVEDFFVGDQAVHDDGIPEDDGFYENPAADEGVAVPRAVPGQFEPFDPRRIPNERDFVLAMTDGDNEGMMDYFDQGFLKSWAGPEHWRLRKAVRRPIDAADVAEPKAKREKKIFRIDFTASSKLSTKELFAPVGRGAGIDLPSASGTKSTRRGKKATPQKDHHTLPDDMHFSSRQLVTLFLKPKFSLKMRGQRVRTNEGEIDEQFWAKAAAEQAAGLRDQEEGDETAGGGAVPFNTQFFHDDYDDAPGFDDGFDGDLPGGVAQVDPLEEADLLAATQGQSRRIRPEAINYSKRAKRVDVRKLKENIWKNLDIIVPQSEDSALDQLPLTNPEDGRAFSSVIDGLRTSYPKDKMEEISTSFCFICLLHLANEQGLKIGVDAAADPDSMEQDVTVNVGDIYSLKVFRDPNATQAA